MAAFPCLSVDVARYWLLGDEVFMQDNATRRIPGAGGTSVLCADHGVSYERRSSAYRFAVKDCSRRGFPIAFGPKCTIACAVRLNDQITHLANVDVPGDDVDSNAPVTQPTKRTATAKLDCGKSSDNRRRGGTGLGSEIASSETSYGSESWEEREMELAKLVSDDRQAGERSRQSKRRTMDKERGADVAPKKPKKRKLGRVRAPHLDLIRVLRVAWRFSRTPRSILIDFRLMLLRIEALHRRRE